MNAPKDPVRLIIDLEVGTNPIRGSLRPVGGAVRTFTGWLQLGDAIERARMFNGPQEGWNRGALRRDPRAR